MQVLLAVVRSYAVTGLIAEVEKMFSSDEIVVVHDFESALSQIRIGVLRAAIVELELPRYAGAELRGTQERISRDHRVVSARFPGTELLGRLAEQLAPSSLMALTSLPMDHPDRRDVAELGIRVAPNSELAGWPIPGLRETQRGRFDGILRP